MLAFLSCKHSDPPHNGPLLVKITFRPPDKRRRDLDNALSSIKAGLDGVADAIGVDDRHWALMLQWGEPVKGGAVELEIEEV
jgi:crossover junction endodeoxyribonuclease RusA